MTLPSLESFDFRNKTALVRLDLNVPMHAGRVLDDTRLVRSIPTLQHLIEQHAKVVIISHLGRPKGTFDASSSLAPLVDAISHAMWDRPVRFAPDCVGTSAKQAVENMDFGEVILMENLRFHPEEEKNDRAFAEQLASLADVYVNEGFSCSHRAHASVVGVTEFLPSFAGRLMLEEVRLLSELFESPEKPLAAVVGGAKVSTKLELLENLVSKVDKLLIGGAMANTFLYALGFNVGESLCETDMKDKAQQILAHAKKVGCEILLPSDVVVADAFKKHANCQILPVDKVPQDGMILDIGPQSLMRVSEILGQCKTIVWNGPLGAFETSPFDASTVTLARLVAGLTAEGKVRSVAGGGDTVAALSHAGLHDAFSYLSTAGGAFLEWLEGKELPGVLALMKQASTKPTAKKRA